MRIWWVVIPILSRESADSILTDVKQELGFVGAGLAPNASMTAMYNDAGSPECCYNCGEPFNDGDAHKSGLCLACRS